MDDQKKESLKEKIKEGVSVQELESLARKYTTEVFLIVAIFIASISSAFDFFTGAGFSIIFAGIGAIVAIALPKNIIPLQKKFFKLVTKQEKSAQIAIGVVRIIIGLFIPFLLFAEIGLLAGCAFHIISKQFSDKTIEK